MINNEEWYRDFNRKLQANGGATDDWYRLTYRGMNVEQRRAAWEQEQRDYQEAQERRDAWRWEMDKRNGVQSSKRGA